MTHDHDHTHHNHDSGPGMPFEEKLAKILQHWIKHNDDHAATYRDWADQARQHRMDAAAALLDEAAQITDTISKKFEAAAGLVRQGS